MSHTWGSSGYTWFGTQESLIAVLGEPHRVQRIKVESHLLYYRFNSIELLDDVSVGTVGLGQPALCHSLLFLVRIHYEISALPGLPLDLGQQFASQAMWLISRVALVISRVVF